MFNCQLHRFIGQKPRKIRVFSIQYQDPNLFCIVFGSTFCRIRLLQDSVFLQESDSNFLGVGSDESPAGAETHSPELSANCHSDRFVRSEIRDFVHSSRRLVTVSYQFQKPSNYVVGWKNHNFLAGLVQYLTKNIANYFEEKKIAKSVLAILRQKKFRYVRPQWHGRTTNRRTFICRFPEFKAFI